jgi:hypothetical protein
MLLARDEMSFDFQRETFDLQKDGELLAWIFNQFLYGEVTGIQCGHWLYNAPDLDAARFLAKQALEEFQHIDNFLHCLAILNAEPATPHPLVQFLATGMMPSTWHEHVCQEMAMGEGFVLVAIYALIDTIEDLEIRAILERAVKQEERHVGFGEERTTALVRQNRSLARRMLGLNLVSFWAMRRLAKKLSKKAGQGHPILSQMPEFLETVIQSGELRLVRMGLVDKPLRKHGWWRRTAWVSEAYLAKLLRLVCAPFRLLPFIGKRKRLTDNYLQDPAVRRAWMEAQNKGRAA